MLTLIEAKDFRCLRYVRREIGRFHVLVGPNSSGKTTFLDVPALLGKLVESGIDAAIGDRTPNFSDLVWRRESDRFELALEARIPEERRTRLTKESLNTVRYEVAMGIHAETKEISVLAEKVILKNGGHSEPQEKLSFPSPLPAPRTLISPKTVKSTQVVVNKVAGGNDNFYDETGKKWDHAFRLGPHKSALGNLPEDEAKFPVATWFKRFIAQAVQQIMLNSLLLRKASPPGQVRGFKPDGSNLPWVIADLASRHPAHFDAWLAHVRTALPDVENVRTIEREDDKHRYLMVRYRGGFEVPSWMVSDGTLRLFALTLPAYLPDFRGVFLIEEPENGIHPGAVETVYQSLSSAYAAQILLATHSPVILSVVDPADVLVFGRTEDGATDIIVGSEHPALKEWKGEPNLSVLFAAGVLG